MHLQKILFTLSLLGILFLIFLSQTTEQIQTGTIKSIQTSSNKITIQLENNSYELIIFDTSFINLKKSDTIEFQGKQSVYENKKQIIVNKIFLN